MKKFLSVLIFGAVANVANAEVISLKCEGVDTKGENFSEIITFNPDQSWVIPDSLGIRLTGAVSPNTIDVFLIDMVINRQTGEFTKEKGSLRFKGNCAKNETKF